MRWLLLLFFTFIGYISFCQENKMGNSLKFLSDEQKNDAFKLNVLVEGDITKLLEAKNTFDFELLYHQNQFASITCNYKTLQNLINEKIIHYTEIPSARKRILNDTMIYRNRIKQVKLWTSPLPQAYNGEGILIGIIDSGTDFSHPDFKDSLGKTRIQFLWDQNVSGTTFAPMPYNYGREWNATQINNNQCTHSDAAYYGHGTHVAGIAAGNGLANGKNEGVAPKANLIVVALNFNRAGPTIADAVNYIFSKAQQQGKPCVINASVGDYYGSHDATDLEAKLIDAQLSNKPGRALIAAAGNAGAYKYHVKTPSVVTDTVFTWLRNNVNTLEYWCYGDTNQFKNLKISCGVNRNNFFDLGKTTFRNYKAGLSAVKRDTIFYNSKRIGIVEMSSSVNSSGVCEWYYKVRKDTLNTFWRIETTGSGLHHAWNFDFVSNGLPSTAQYPKITKYMMPDTFYTMVSSFQNSEEVITVGNYVNLYQYRNVNNQIKSLGETGGKIAITSSSGPTRDGRIKPDITATGNSVFSAIVLSLKPYFVNNEPDKVALGGFHILGGGTSAAAPVVAGLAALYLQRYPTASNLQIKDAIRYCAYKDDYTSSNLPNYQWGFGKLDGKAAMSCNDVKVFTGIKASDENLLSCYPNPTSDKVLFNLKNAGEGRYSVYNLTGSKIYENVFENHSFEIDLNAICSDYKGLLLVKVESLQTVFSVKVIKQ